MMDTREVQAELIADARRGARVSAEDLAGLGAAGYDVVVNLLPDDSTYAVEGEEAIVRGQGLRYVPIPIDFATPTHEQLEEFVEAMDANEGRRVHVHCAANYRVSAFYSLYAMRRGWWTAEEADELYRATRSVLASSIELLRERVPPTFEKQVRDHLSVHNRGGEACPRCGTRITEVKAGGFPTGFCRGCQR